MAASPKHRAPTPIEGQTRPTTALASSRITDWHRMTVSEFRALDPKRTVVLVACAPIEVHGPHLPMCADVREAEGLHDLAARKLLELDPETRFIRLPAVCMGADVLPQRGSVSFSPHTVIRVLEELGRTLAHQGFQHIWVSNFHGGPRHVLALEQACHNVNRRHGTKMLSIFSLLLKKLTGGSSDLADRLGGIGGISTEELRGDAHGGLVETAMLVALEGSEVDPSYPSLPPRSLEIQLQEQGRPPLQKGEKPTLFEMLRSLPLRQRYYETETYAGAPAKASAELGRAYLEELSRDSAEELLAVWRGTTQASEAHSPLWKLRHVLLNRGVGWLFDRLFAGQRNTV
jgi:creatinine amidohydrolase